ncbi:MAG: hypothetical protein IKF17_05760 [Clostridia bacterium]|nr:hypothetical protein [Clostridia bacterium]
MEENIVEEAIDDNDVNVGEVQEEQVEVDTSNEESELEVAQDEPVEETTEEPVEPRTYTEEEYQRAINKIIARERSRYEKQINPLINTLKAGGFEEDTLPALTNSIQKSYENQGINIPKYDQMLTEKEQKALAKADAEEVIDLGEEVMKQTFAELYAKEDRSVREEELMYLISQEHSKRMAKKDLLELGADPDKVLNDSKFKDFAKKWSSDVSVKEIYQAYKKLNDKPVQKPASAGSVKNNESETNKYTQAKIDNMTPQEMAEAWEDPEFRKIAGLN